MFAAVLVEKQPVPAGKGVPSALNGGKENTKPRPEGVPAFKDPPARARGNRQYGRTIPIGHADELIGRHAGARADQSVESIAAFGRINRVSACGKRDGLCWIELAGVKAHDIVRLCIGWPIVLPPKAKLEA